MLEDSGAPERRRRIVLCVLIAAVTLLSFWPVLSNAFLQWDDKLTIYENPHLSGWTLENLRWFWTTFHMGPYQPLSWMSLAADHAAWGPNPAGYHLTNLLLHTASALFFFAVLLRATRKPIPSFLGAMVFAVHPLRVEPVAWATERREVLSGFFFLAGWLAYLRCHQRKEAPPGAPSWPLASFLLYAAAMLSKVIAAGLIWVLVLSDVFVLHRLSADWKLWGGREYRKVWLEKFPFLFAAVTALAVGWFGVRAGGYFSHPYSLLQRLLLFTYGATFYIEKTLVPWALSPLYPLPLDWSSMSVEFAVRSSIFLAVTLWLLRRRSRDPFPAFAWLAYLLILLPVSGIAQCSRHIAADRYAYLCCLPVVWAAVVKLHWKRRYWPAAAAVVAILMGLTWRQCGYWRSDRLLWSRAIAVDPQNRTARYNLGTLLMPTDPRDALEEFLMVLKLDPDDAEAQFNTASLYGRTAQAVPHYREALRLRPRWTQAMNNLALVQITLRNYAEAMDLLNRALAIDDQFAEGRFNRGALFMMEGRPAAGKADLSRAVREKPELGLRLGKVQGRLVR